MLPNGPDLHDFLLRACHDLKTPLRAVRTNAELLLKDPQRREGPDCEQLLGFLVNGARNADAVVDGLANYAVALRIQRSALPVPALVLLKGALAKLGPEIRSAGAEITFDELPRTTADPDRLVQLFENLLRNALQTSAEVAPRIHVGGREQDSGWIFSVRDNGPGIETEDLERIFRPFERLKRERGGAGLGLAICRQIASGHGGRIWAESTPGNGATFYFTIHDG
jgi:chemotaxis family two-component system sensor kinase Cph1